MQEQSLLQARLRGLAYECLRSNSCVLLLRRTEARHRWKPATLGQAVLCSIAADADIVECCCTFVLDCEQRSCLLLQMMW